MSHAHGPRVDDGTSPSMAAAQGIALLACLAMYAVFALQYFGHIDVFALLFGGGGGGH